MLTQIYGILGPFGILTWMVILIMVWHEYQNGYKVDDLFEVFLLGGVLGGLMAAIWPVTWFLTVMFVVSGALYSLSQIIADRYDDFKHRSRVTKSRNPYDSY